MLFQCWPIVYDAGPTLKHHWFNDQNYNKMPDVCFMHCGQVQRLQDIIHGWLNVGPASVTLAQHQTNAGTTRETAHMLSQR